MFKTHGANWGFLEPSSPISMFLQLIFNPQMGFLTKICATFVCYYKPIPRVFVIELTEQIWLSFQGPFCTNMCAFWCFGWIIEIHCGTPLIFSSHQNCRGV
jgi:hypothetical protein